MTNDGKVTVFYDGACPLCAREIAFYKRRRGAKAILWVDVSNAPGGMVAPGLPKRQALARFHVMTAAGRLVSGGEAFAYLWSALPAFQLLGRVFRTWPLGWVIDRAYDVFLRLRPRLRSALCRL